MLTWNSLVQVKYTNLLILAKITSIQCVSTFSCERAFSIQNCVKSEFRNKLKRQHLESMLCITLEGPEEGCEPLLVKAIGLWEKSTKFMFYIEYLVGATTSNPLNGDNEGIPNY